MKIYTNYYEELISLNLDESEPITDFNFMEGSPIFGPNGSNWQQPKNLNPYDFLHGYCHIFALALHNQFHYPIYVIKNSNNEIVHFYCKDIFKDKPIYIDVRGITNDFDTFANEFEDFINKQDMLLHSTLANIQEIENSIKHDKEENILQTAEYIIDDQINGYNSKCLIKSHKIA